MALHALGFLLLIGMMILLMIVAIILIAMDDMAFPEARRDTTTLHMLPVEISDITREDVT